MSWPSRRRNSTAGCRRRRRTTTVLLLDQRRRRPSCPCRQSGCCFAGSGTHVGSPATAVTRRLPLSDSAGIEAERPGRGRDRRGCFEKVANRLDRHARRDFAGLMSAHAVGDDEQARSADPTTMRPRCWGGPARVRNARGGEHQPRFRRRGLARRHTNWSRAAFNTAMAAGLRLRRPAINCGGRHSRKARSERYTATVVSVALQRRHRARPGGARAGPRRRRGAILAPALRVDVAHARRRARRPRRARRSVAAAGRSRSGGAGARPSARHLPRHRAAAPALARCGGCTAASRRARGDQSRAIALHGRALKQAEAGARLARHRPRALRARPLLPAGRRRARSSASTSPRRPSALHAAGDRRHLALVHSLSGISLAQLGRYDEAMAALRQAERLASTVQADDVLATVCGNQANVMMMQHRYEQALALAERSVALHEAHGSGHGLARRARHARPDLRAPRRSDARRGRAAPRARGPQPDSVPRDDRRGLRHAGADSPDPRPLRHGQRFSAARRRSVRRLRPPDQPLVRVVGARARRAAGAAARRARRGASRAPTRSLQAGAPPFDALQATLIAAEALIAANRARRGRAAARRRPPTRSIRAVAPGAWGEYLRLRGALHAQAGSAADAYHDFAQSASAARSARRALPGRAQPPRARPAGGARPARARSPSGT